MDTHNNSLVHCIVPARLASSRFPAKPLVELCGKPMVIRTLERAQTAQCFGRIICATDSPIIAQLAESAGFESVITPHFATGSDRVAYVAQQLGLDCVVNLQGDEPVVGTTILQKMAQALSQEPSHWVTACAPLHPADHGRTSVVKVHVEQGYATDFCREASAFGANWFMHRGLYGYSAVCRAQFQSLPQSTLELERSLEQMRILGLCPIRVIQDPDTSASVDLPSDVPLVERMIKESQL